MAAGTSDAADRRHRHPCELVAVRLSGPGDPSQDRASPAAGERSQAPVHGRAASRAEAGRGHDEDRGCRLPVDRRGNELRVGLRRQEHGQVVDEVLGPGDERHLDRIAAALRRLQEPEQPQLRRDAEAARAFYADDRLARRKALPPTALTLLQDKGSVALLDGPAHRLRQAILLQL